MPRHRTAQPALGACAAGRCLHDGARARRHRRIDAGDIAPGAPLIETALSTRFDVSRGPLREALRQLIEEGLLVTVPYTGTHVAALSVEDVREIYSLRTALEIFAFEQVVGAPRRALPPPSSTGATRRCWPASMPATIAPASRPSSRCTAWSTRRAATSCCSAPGTGLRGRLQLYWAAHHRAHGRRGPRRDSHDSYIKAALGSDLEAMRAEIADHMRRGAVEHGEVFT